MALSFARLKALYDAKRKLDKHIGRQYDKDRWFKPTEDGTGFVMSYVVSKWYEIKNENPAIPSVHMAASAKERDKYTMRAQVWIYPDRIEVPLSLVALGPALNKTLYLFDLGVKKNPSVKTPGYIFSTLKRSETYPHPSVPADSINVGPNGTAVFDTADKVLRTNTPPPVRVFNNDIRKPLNAHILKVRRMLDLRVRFGAFAGITFDRRFYNGRSIAQLVDALNAVDEEDYMSLLPILQSAVAHASYREISELRTGNHDSLLPIFNRYIASNREAIRRHTGAVTYVEENDQGAT